MKTRTNQDNGGGVISAPHLRPIQVSLAVAAHAARTYDLKHRHAVLWLANLAANSRRIQLCWQRRGLPDPLGTVGQIAEVELAKKLDLEPLAILRALTGHSEADLPAFTAAVTKFRAEFEAALPPLIPTADAATVAEAFAAASDEHEIAELRGKWRHGKTELCERQWLLNLHRAVWIDTPSDNAQQTFVLSIGKALGIGSHYNLARLHSRVKDAVGVGLIDTLMFDEAQNLWPGDLRDSKPARAEYVRELHDSTGVGSMLITTEQFALSMEIAKQRNTRYAPGQLFGRIRSFTTTDKHTDAEIKAIAKLHVGKADADAIHALVLFAKAQEGYLGAMVQAARRARVATTAAGNDTVTAADIAKATLAQQHDQRIVQMAGAVKLNKKGRVAA